MFHNARAAFVVAGLVGLVTLPFVAVMLALVAIGASAGAIIGLGFLAMLGCGFFVASQRGQSFLGGQLRKAVRRG